MKPIPDSVSVPWADLLKRRVLLHQTVRAVGGADRFDELTRSQLLDDQNLAAAVEGHANRTFNLVVDLTGALMIEKAPEDSAAVKAMSADELLAAASRQRIFPGKQWEVLDELRYGRNDLQHGSSWVPTRQVWRFIKLVEDSIDKVLHSLQQAFDQVELKLEMDFPDDFVGVR